MASEFGLNSQQVMSKITNRLQSKLDRFDRQVLKQLRKPADKGGVWAYDYNRRKDQKYPHSVTKWTSYNASKWAKYSDKIVYVYRNKAQNNSKQYYAQYLKGEPYH
jgi:hypothetical protein